MTSLIVGAVLLIAGNVIGNRSLATPRPTERLSRERAAWERAISVGGVINMIGAVFLLIGLWSLIF